MIIYHDGRFLNPHEPALLASNGGFLHGQGVFTTLLVRSGRPRRLGDHRQRLEQHARDLGLPLPLPLDHLDEVISQLIDVNHMVGDDLRLRVNLSQQGQTTQLTLLPGPLPPTLDLWRRQGVAAITLGPEFQRRWLPHLKTCCTQPSLLALARANSRGAQDALIFAEDDHLLEGAISNVFLVRDGTLLTPPDRGRILAGLTRREVLAQARFQALPIRDEGEISRADLEAADEVFLTNAVRGVVPVTRVDGASLGSGQPGPITLALLAAWMDSD